MCALPKYVKFVKYYCSVPGGKCGRSVRLTNLPPSSAVIMKFGNLNFLEPSGPLQALNGTALPLLLQFICVLLTNNKKKQRLFLNPYPTAFPYGNGMVLHFYQQQESSTTKTVHKVINKGLKTYV